MEVNTESSAFYNGSPPWSWTKEKRIEMLKRLRTQQYCYFEYEREEQGYLRPRRRIVELMKDCLVDSDYEELGSDALYEMGDLKELCAELLAKLKWTTLSGRSGPDDFCIVTSNSEEGVMMQRLATRATMFVYRHILQYVTTESAPVKEEA